MATARAVLAITLGTMLLGGLLTISSAVAEEDAGLDRELRRLMTRIEVLHHEAKALESEGRHDAAELFMKRARQLKEEAQELKQRGKEAPGKLTRERAEAALRGLRNGMEALELLGRPRELAALREIAHGLGRRLEMAEHARRQEMEEHERRRAGHDREIDVARQQLDLMRTAMTAFREAERREAAEEMELAMHAIELAIEGQRERAGEARKKAPKPGQMAELLGFASKLWAEWGHESKAEALADLSRVYAKRHRAQAKTEKVRKGKAGEKRAKKEKARKGKADRDVPLEEVMERMEVLQMHIHELHAHVERLTEQVQLLLAERE